MSELCKNASVFYVAGLGGISASDYQRVLKDLIESIFGLYFEPKTKIFANNSWLLSQDKNLTPNIIKTALDHHHCKHISMVWFCHSHGAKMVCDAYKELKETEQFDRIWNSSAIICIGGVSLAKKDLAKVVFNVEYKNDDYSQAGSHLVGKRNKAEVFKIGPYKNKVCGCCDGSRSPEMEEAETQISTGLFCGLSASSKQSSASSFDYEKAHVIKEYMACKKWRIMVNKLLPLSQSVCKSKSD